MCVGGVGGGGSSFVGTGHVWRSPQNYLDVDGCVWLPHSMSVYVCLLFWVSCVIVWFFWVARLANKLVTLRDAADPGLKFIGPKSHTRRTPSTGEPNSFNAQGMSENWHNPSARL